MSKDQVSGSLTLSLSGLADAVAERVTEALRAETTRQDHLSLDESVRLLVGQVVPVAYGEQVGKSIATRLWDLGYRITGPETTAVPRLLDPEEVDQESAVAWFKKEVGL